MARGAVRVVFRVLAVGPDKVAELAGNGREYVGVVGARLQVGTLGGAGIYAAGYTVLLNDEGADYAAYGAHRVDVQSEEFPVLVVDVYFSVCEDSGAHHDAAGDSFAEGVDERHACRVEVGDIPADECRHSGIACVFPAGFIGGDVHVTAGDGFALIGSAVALLPEAEGGYSKNCLAIAHGNAEYEVLRVAILGAGA